jgi:hypothetical protein
MGLVLQNGGDMLLRRISYVTSHGAEVSLLLKVLGGYNEHTE